MPRTDFNSHAPCGAQRIYSAQKMFLVYFNSHAPCGAQQKCQVVILHKLYFNSHAPCGAQLGNSNFSPFLYLDFNSHAPCWAQPTDSRDTDFPGWISTHTPHAGRNFIFINNLYQLLNYFNSHAPCGAQRSGDKINFSLC